MKTTIYFFTGTGNSLKIAQSICEKVKDCELVSIVKIWEDDVIKSATEKVGIVFPLYYAGLPKIVKDFMTKMDFSKSEYFFSVVTYAGDTTDFPFVQIEQILAKQSKRLNAAFPVLMPNNFILGYDIHPKERQLEFFKKADNTTDEIVKLIEEKVDNFSVNTSEDILTQKAKFNKSFHEKVNKSDKEFYSDENCNSCGICEKICPVKNIILVDGKPEWQHKCQQCLACINYCPEKAIQFGSHTLKTQRYHHPEFDSKLLMDKFFK